ncbi:hypothetical protein BDN72DRAFT_837390 [Pluteus cervinus]|uniref:Uncharacterized protein n=1 Tax=Pluteus cervinus TaxID=181527 RepID=A0ACD3B0X5_9AGAR|nr:hypothetical protein BDN72DRAFT_837390 [Pluteus cervinus]
MAGDRDTLVGMGFDSARVDWALKATGNRGLQPAMDHILEHDGQPVPELSGVTESASSARPSDAMDVDEDGEAAALGISDVGEAKSIKCSECGKIFRNTALANFHAEKSGHDQFEESTEEIKPLTEEEKKEKLEELRTRLVEKRAKKAEQDAIENRANENLRRKAGKDMNKIKEELKEKEAIKEAEQKRRDKIEDAKARAAVKAQIEADKKTRADKLAREKAIREGREVIDPPAASTSAAPAAPAKPAVSKDFKETRLQIRIPGGQPLTTTLPSDAPLRAVAEFLAGQSLQFDVETVSLSCQFPRKTYTQEDLSKSLKDLGLTPSAVLIANP